MADTSRILVVDDDDQVRTLLRRVLSAEGFAVDLAATGADGLRALAAEPPDLVLLDVNLPDEDGRDVLAKVRDAGDVPVILLTGMGEEHDRILGLKLGADDYVVKPFSPGELAARIQTILRRTSAAAAAAKPTPTGNVLAFDGLSIDLASREVRVGGRVVEMTAKEFDLLAFLASSPRQVFSRAQLLDHVWASSPEWQDDATVTEHVRRVRRRIEEDPLRPRWVLTVRGAGYRFEP
jgi:two-component system, OmpR family, phosphate regulon response regulator PhoB